MSTAMPLSDHGQHLHSVAVLDEPQHLDCQAFVNLESELPGCQWQLLQIPGLAPPPARDLILSKVAVPEPATTTEASS
ncbi:hypothetical protein AB0C98_10865 [Streptomyces sp. NPDC048558]|uniref:hypothetical protein n=1 Tax=Streptomyces sp. NPDC048558 TaxID=3155759 RepID=UPI0033C8E906